MQKLACQTNAHDPVLPIPISDTWYFLNAVLNDLSEQFAVGLLKRDSGAPVVATTYLVALTSESAGEMRTRKIRAMVTKGKEFHPNAANVAKYEALYKSYLGLYPALCESFGKLAGI